MIWAFPSDKTPGIAMHFPFWPVVPRIVVILHAVDNAISSSDPGSDLMGRDSPQFAFGSCFTYFRHPFLRRKFFVDPNLREFFCNRFATREFGNPTRVWQAGCDRQAHGADSRLKSSASASKQDEKRSPRNPLLLQAAGQCSLRHISCQNLSRRASTPKRLSNLHVSTPRADAGGYWAGKVRFRGPQWTLRMAP